LIVHAAPESEQEALLKCVQLLPLLQNKLSMLMNDCKRVLKKHVYSC